MAIIRPVKNNMHDESFDSLWHPGITSVINTILAFHCKLILGQCNSWGAGVKESTTTSENPCVQKAKSYLMPKAFSGQICGSMDTTDIRIQSRKSLQNCVWWVGHDRGSPLAAPLQSGRQHLCSNPNALFFWKRKWGQQNHFGDKPGLINNYVLWVFLSKLKTNIEKSMASLLQWARQISVSFTQKIRSNLEHIASHLSFCSFFNMLFIYIIFDIEHLEAFFNGVTEIAL